MNAELYFERHKEFSIYDFRLTIGGRRKADSGPVMSYELREASDEVRERDGDKGIKG
jgi:hypothetical protein